MRTDEAEYQLRYFIFWVILVVGALTTGVGVAVGISLLTYSMGPVGVIPMALAFLVVLIAIPEAVNWLADKMGIE